MQLPTGFLGVVKPMTMVTQDGRPFVEYYNALNLIFMELDYWRPNYMTCIADIEKRRKRIAEDRVYIFFVGLDHSLDQVNDSVLAPLLYQV